MIDEVDFDPALAGAWPLGGGASYEPELDGYLDAVRLETKSEPSRVEELQRLLNDMQTELRAQFGLLKQMRERAQARIEDADEAEVKLAKADVKSASDTLSLLVRTMEKIDALQRTLAEAEMRADEEALDDEAIAALRLAIEHRIEERAAELAFKKPGRGDEENPRGPPDQ